MRYLWCLLLRLFPESLCSRGPSGIVLFHSMHHVWEASLRERLARLSLPPDTLETLQIY